MDFQKALSIVLAEVREVADAVDGAETDALARALLAARAIFLVGEGRSGLVARAFAMRLAHLGFNVHVVGETTAPAVGEGDLLVAVSGSGHTHVTLHLARSAKGAGAGLAAVTADPESALAAEAATVLIVPGRVKTGRGFASAQMPGSLFEQAAFVTLEAVVLVLVGARKESHDGMRRRHTNLE